MSIADKIVKATDIIDQEGSSHMEIESAVD